MALPSYIEDINTWKEGFKYSSPVVVRFSETDAFGHLNNTVPFIYFEQVRINYLKELGLMEEWFSDTAESIIVTADMHCDYVKQVYFDEKLQVFVKVAQIGRSSFDLHYMVLNEKEVIVLTGRGRIVQVSKRNGQPTPWNDEIIALLKDSLSF